MLCKTCFGTNSTCLACGGSGALPAPSAVVVQPKRNIRTFGTPQNPLHASALPGLMACPWRLALLFLYTPDEEPGIAADTGSATHTAVAAWHRDKDLAAAVRAMREASDAGHFPRADLDEAAALFLLYSRDPRNQEAEIAKDTEGRFLVEYPVSFTIRPSSEDTTEAPIAIIGTLDQVRITNGQPKIWDLKTSKRPGLELLSTHLYQMAAYAIGASSVMQKVVGMGGLITPRHYGRMQPEHKPAGVFWDYPHRFNDIEWLLNGIRRVVANIRAGDIHVSPGDYCRWCPGHGTEQCVPMLRDASDPATHRIRLPQNTGRVSNS